MRQANVDLLHLFEFLLEQISTHYKHEWYPEFIDFFASWSHLFEPWLTEFQTEEQRLIWFLVKFTETED